MKHTLNCDLNMVAGSDHKYCECTCHPFTRYFFNKVTGQFIQLKPTIEKPFNNDWVEIDSNAFAYLLDMRNTLLDLERYIRAGSIKMKSDKQFCIDKIEEALAHV